MKKTLVFLFLISFGFTAFSQQTAAGKFAGIISPDLLKQYLTVLSSDEFAGRETSTPGEEKAAQYVASQFKAAGLSKFKKKRKYLQFYKVEKDSFLSAALSINSATYLPGRSFVMYTTPSFTQEAKGTDLVFVGYGISDSLYDDYGSKDVQGKIVVFADGEPMNADSTWLLSGNKRPSSWLADGEMMKLKEAAKRGAKGILSFNLQFPSFSDTARRFIMRNALKFNREPAPLNRAYLSYRLLDSIYGKEAFKTVLDAVKQRKKLNQVEVKDVPAKVELVYKEGVEKRKARNVVGYIKGAEKPDEYVFVTAHMDHLGTGPAGIYHGADDDGSGTSAVIANATAFAAAAKEGFRPKRSIIFMTVSGEEKGLWGSAYATDHPVVDLAKVSADVNIDMIGRVDPKRKKGDSLNYIFAVGSDKISTEMRPLLERVNKETSNLELDYKFDDPNDRERIYFRSDHFNFAKHGVPIVFFYNGSHPDYHRVTDTIDKINFKLMAKRAQLAFFLAWELANRENPLVRDLPIPTAVR